MRAGSLKDKRMYLRRMRDTLTRRYGATFAEVGYQDLWQRVRWCSPSRPPIRMCSRRP